MSFKYLQRPEPARRASALLAVACIAAYQKHLSPRKGFSCAHRLRHGGLSCSEFIKRAIAEHGVVAAAPMAQARLGECKAAALAMSLGEGEDGRKRDWCSILDACDLSCTGADCALSGADCIGCDAGCLPCS